MARVFNFSAGPSMLPLPVLQKAQAELTEYGCSGQSVLEMSHRSSWFEDIIAGTEAASAPRAERAGKLQNRLFQGGASTQFAAVPLNLMGTGSADYIVTGQFSGKAAKEAEKYGRANIIASSKDKNFTYIPDVASLEVYPRRKLCAHLPEQHNLRHALAQAAADGHRCRWWRICPAVSSASRWTSHSTASSTSAFRKLWLLRAWRWSSCARTARPRPAGHALPC